MNYYIYDKTLEGLLSLVFDAYANKVFPDSILSEQDVLPFFSDAVFRVQTDAEKAQRVWAGLLKKVSKEAARQLSVVYMSELAEVDMLIFRYLCKAFAGKQSVEVNFGDDDVLQMQKIYRKVSREAERVRMFVRFQKTADGIFFAPFEPKYNVLPLVADFFEERFADQPFIIYDVKRKYGLYYDLQKTVEVNFDKLDFDFITGKLSDAQAAEDEQLFQQLWKGYFKAIAIKERTNLKLHRQLLPKRFWKFLPEKQ
ncbi:MAG: TIGR03915 family putative DNA repair protein [Prevotellaceae bacterium]|nr:TIGR03915 family putative DNA repair protein [Prevotellaceae bacterium]